MDNGASYHLTSKKSNIFNAITYSSSKRVILGNGNSLPITHSKSTVITSGYLPLMLNNLLYVPYLAKNLVYFDHICVDNHVLDESYPSSFCVKELDMNKILLIGRIEQGL